MKIIEISKYRKARSAYAFIAACESARKRNARNDIPHAPRSGAVNSITPVLFIIFNLNATPLRGVRKYHSHLNTSCPCALAHGYKRISATRFFVKNSIDDKIPLGVSK